MSCLAVLLIAALGMEDGATAQDPPAPESFKGHSVPQDQRAPVAYELSNGRIVFKVQVAGRDVWAILDTNATRSMMDVELARSLGLSLGPVEELNDGSGGGVSVQKVSDVPILIPGQFEARYPRLDAANLREIAATLDRRIDFVLAGDILWRSALFIDPGTQTFHLSRSGSFKAPATAQEVSLQKKGAPQIELTIGSEKAIVSIATGARGPLYLNPAAWQRIVPKDATVSAVTALAGQPSIKKVVLAEVAIGPFRMRDIEARELPRQMPADGFLGMAVLGQFRIVLDVEAGKMWFGPSPPRVSK